MNHFRFIVITIFFKILIRISWHTLGTELKNLLAQSWHGYVFDSQLDS